MIPIRIYLQGFMSYRDETELSFDGASLWMLSGHNGAGKSAIFDAITYALYGKHRGGAQNSEELINKQADGLVVEFDFAVAQHKYRIRRTLSRRGRVGCQAYQWNGTTFKPIPETNAVRDLDWWVVQTIGLEEPTFTASVLLRQGESDALLKATSSERHEMLSQIVDLSAYQKLYQQADQRQKKLDTQADTLKNQAATFSEVTDAELQILDEQIEAARAASTEAQQRFQELGKLKVHAQHWANLVDAQTNAQHKLEEAQELLTHAEQIKREKARLDELYLVLPRLKDLLNECERLSTCEQSIAHYSEAAQSWEELAEQTDAALSQLEEAWS